MRSTTEKIIGPSQFKNSGNRLVRATSDQGLNIIFIIGNITFNFQRKTKLGLWVSEIHFFEPLKFLIFCQCVGVTERLYALIGPRVNSKHVKYTLNMLSNHGKHLKKVSRKKIKMYF